MSPAVDGFVIFGVEVGDIFVNFPTASLDIFAYVRYNNILYYSFIRRSLYAGSR